MNFDSGQWQMLGRRSIQRASPELYCLQDSLPAASSPVIQQLAEPEVVPAALCLTALEGPTVPDFL